MNKENKFGPDIVEPSNAEIEKTIQKVQKRFGFILERDDAIEFTKLRNELAWWVKVERGSKNPASISEKIAKEVQAYTKEHYGNEISLEEASENARSAVSEIVPVEKKRIQDQTKSIINKYLK